MKPQTTAGGMSAGGPRASTRYQGFLIISIFHKLSTCKRQACPWLSSPVNDLVQSLMTAISPPQSKSIPKTRFGFFVFSSNHSVPPHFVNVQSALRCHDCIHLFAWLFPSKITLFQEQVLTQAIVEWNALFKIPKFFFSDVLRLSTRWSQDFLFLFSLGFGRHHPTSCGHYLLQCTVFLTLPPPQAVCASLPPAPSFFTTSCHQFFLLLEGGGGGGF